MHFQLFTQLFNKIDAITATFITEMSSKCIVAITPVVSVGLTISFITYGLLIIKGVIAQPVIEFLAKITQISLITSIALAGGLYQSDIAGSISKAPDELINALISNPLEERGAAAAIDEAAGKGFRLASEAFEKSGFFSKEGLIYCAYGIIILLTTSVFVAIGGAILLVTKLALAVLAGLGPFFIVALLWQPTARFFDMWVAQVVNYILLMVLFTALFGLMLSIYSTYLHNMHMDGIDNIAYGLGGAVVLSIAMIIVLLQLPTIAVGLAGGVSLGYLNEFRAVRARAAGAYLGSGNRTSNNSTGGTEKNGGRRLAQGSDGATAGGKAPYGYYKGNIGKTAIKH